MSIHGKSATAFPGIGQASNRWMIVLLCWLVAPATGWAATTPLSRVTEGLVTEALAANQGLHFELRLPPQFHLMEVDTDPNLLERAKNLHLTKEEIERAVEDSYHADDDEQPEEQSDEKEPPEGEPQ